MGISHSFFMSYCLIIICLVFSLLGVKTPGLFSQIQAWSGFSNLVSIN